MNYELRWPPSANKGSVRDPLVKPYPFIQDGLTKGDLPTQTVHGIPKNLPWVWQGLLFCNEYITSQKKKTLGSNNRKNIHSKPSRKIKEWFACFFCFDLANAKNQETPFDPKKSHKLLNWMLKFAHDTLDGEKFTISKRADRYSWVQFLFSNKENPWKSTTI